MIDIDALEALAKAATSGLPGDRIPFALRVMDPEGILALIAEVRALRTRLEIDPRHSYDGIDCRDETIRQLEDEVRALREAPSEADILRALHTWFSPDHPDQNDFVSRMRKAIDAARKEQA